VATMVRPGSEDGAELVALCASTRATSPMAARLMSAAVTSEFSHLNDLRGGGAGDHPLLGPNSATACAATFRGRKLATSGNEFVVAPQW
jgi:hypothetical protein